MKRFNLLRRSLVIAGLTVYTLVFAEIFVRLVDPQPIMPRYVTGTPWGVRGNIPNARYWHHTPEVTVEYRINSQGMRSDREYALAKPRGVCRVALFGDSFFMGYELDLKDTFAVQLERQLRARGRNVEVLNFSVSGFGQAEMLRTYVSYGRKFDPDVVIFEWHSTDPDDNMRSGLYRLVGDQLERGQAEYLPGIKLQDALMKSKLYRTIADNSQLYSVIREGTARTAKDLLVRVKRAYTARLRPVISTREDPDDAGGFDEAAMPPSKIALSAALLESAQREIVEDGRDFFVVDTPSPISRTQFRSSMDALPMATRSRLKIISPSKRFADVARPDLKLYYERGQGHLTPLGVRVLTEETLAWLAPSRFFVACARPRGH